MDYRLVSRESPHVDFDGEAFYRREENRSVPMVVLNRAFFQREAESLFQRFEKDSEGESEGIHLTSRDWKTLEERLLRLDPAKYPKFSRSDRESLESLRLALEGRAWRPLFERTREETSSRRERLSRFVEGFTSIRLETIEHHEVSHLLDLSQASDPDAPGFNHFTELNAFFTELAYGSNPHDVMAQAMTGLLDELRRGRPVDYSAAKVAAVLRFLRDCPQRGNFPSGRSLAEPCLERLAKIQKNEWVLVGKSLYRPLAPTRHLAVNH
jgi:hypothetical protein